MDHATLRLILLVCGILLILGIYFFDRMARKREKQQQEHYEPLLSDKASEIKNIDDELDRLSAVHTETKKVEPRIEPTLNEKKADKPPPAEMILQIYVLGREADINGIAIEKAAQALELVAAKEVGIYDRRLGDSKTILYSMANLANPGTFPFDNMADFSCPGVALFARLPNAQEGGAIYSDMLFSAEQLAIQLDAELQDETYSDLTKQRIEHTREQIKNFQRQLLLDEKRELHSEE
jgi:cell division protein ZipA